MERLSPLDSAFLRMERRTTPLHIASVAIFDGPAPSIDVVRGRLADKLDLLPRYRQRLCDPVLPMRAPGWFDDPDFDINRHVHHATLPIGEDFDEFVAHRMQFPLRRIRPLWETWLIDGLPNGEWALISKVHHCMVD